MSLTDFFRINLPYCIKRNDKGEWVALNREYKPLGFDDSRAYHDLLNDYPIFTKYKRLTEPRLLKLAGNQAIKRDDSGKIDTVFLYNDDTNPADNNEYWDVYSEKIKMLSKWTKDSKS